MPVKKPEPVSRSKDIIISSVISIAITIVFGYYFLYIGIRERKPTFYVDPTRTTILDKENAANAPLQLLKANGDTIKSDVTSVYFYFFNQGKETIKEENIYAPLRISLGDSAKVLDYKILKVARSVSGLALQRDSSNQTVLINFKALEQDDGIAGQLIFEGNKNTPITLSGGIDGVKQFETRLIAINPLYFVVALAIFLIAAYIYLVLSKRYPKNSLTLLFFFSAIPIIYLLLVLYKTEWFVSHTVPETLKLEQYYDAGNSTLFAIPSWFR
ncbi:MAG: hypothetical protein K2U26_16615 [Cyclobacteriaceae bacterium]|nr:hypothetical protein [Cyclobacteriaceae bacterium]